LRIDDLATAPVSDSRYPYRALRDRCATFHAAVFSSEPNAGIPLGDGRTNPLGPDNLLLASATNVLPGLFRNYQGKLDGNGDGRISIALPKISALTGVTLYTAFVNFGTGGILNISNDHQVTVQ